MKTWQSLKVTGPKISLFSFLTYFGIHWLQGKTCASNYRRPVLSSSPHPYFKIVINSKEEKTRYGLFSCSNFRRISLLPFYLLRMEMIIISGDEQPYHYSEFITYRDSNLKTPVWYPLAKSKESGGWNRGEFCYWLEWDSFVFLPRQTYIDLCGSLAKQTLSKKSLGVSSPMETYVWGEFLERKTLWGEISMGSSKGLGLPSALKKTAGFLLDLSW